MDELKFMKLPTVEAKTGRKKSAIYSDPSFPAPIHVGRSSFWIASEIEAWMAAQIASSRDPMATKQRCKSDRKRQAVSCSPQRVVLASETDGGL